MMLRLILIRTGQAVLTAFAATVIAWMLLPLAPGDPAVRILLSTGKSDFTAVDVAELRHELGLDRPMFQQFIDWLWRLSHGDLGTSFASGKPVMEAIVQRLPATILLLGLALVFSVALSLIFALVAAAWRDRWPDRVLRFYSQVGAAIPTFIVALVALTYLVVGANMGRVLANVGWQAALMPALIIGIDRAASWTQLLRAGLLEQMVSNYANIARSRGASERRILVRHALPNAFLPFLTAIGVSVGALIGGAPLIEAIFTWPGLGSYLLTALSSRDYPVIQAYVLFAAFSYVIAAFLVELAAIAIDPRLRQRAA